MIQRNMNDLMEVQKHIRVPPGTREVPEEERLQTLKDLREAQKEIITALERFPVANLTVKRSH